MAAAGEREASLGITEFLTPGPGFLAITKLRFTDFIVHEVTLSGQTVRLEALAEVPAAPASAAASAPGPGAPDAPVEPVEVAAEAALAAVVGLEVAQALCRLQASAKAAGGAAQSEPVLLPRDDDKVSRKAVHQLVKQHLLPLVSDTADAEGGGKCVRVQAPAAARAANKAGGKRQRVDNREEWPAEAAGKRYLSFTLYKENRDTLQAVQELARLLRVGQNLFGFAGTKDRRGVTSQRVTLFRVPAQKVLDAFKRRPFGDQLAVGGLAYVAEPLKLGMLGGNRFTIVLRDVKGVADAAKGAAGDAALTSGDAINSGGAINSGDGISHEQLGAALAALADRGFVNYFGLQRFGANAAAPTHQVGAALLRCDWPEALRLLLLPRLGERADEAAAREAWLPSSGSGGGDAAAAAAALRLMPHRMHVERTLLEGVVTHGPTNVLAVMSRLPRHLRQMYLHALQSCVWNQAASARLRRYGDRAAVAGDLVLPPSSAADAAAAAAAAAAAVAGGEPAAGGEAEAGAEVGAEAAEEAEAAVGELQAEAKVHVVTEAEAAASVYSIRDVVLPLPGHKVSFPENETRGAYDLALAAHRLDLAAFRHKVKELALPGAYRRLIGQPQHTEWEVLRYDDASLPLAATDLTDLRGEAAPKGTPDGKRTAVRLSFTLLPSSYATMCLRELTKQSTELGHQLALGVAADTAAAAAPAPAAAPDAASAVAAPCPAAAAAAPPAAPTDGMPPVGGGGASSSQ